MDQTSGEMVLLTEWTIDHNSNDGTNLKKQIASIEQEFSHLTKLNHQNLARYQSILNKYNEEENITVFYTLREFIYGEYLVLILDIPRLTLRISAITQILTMN